MDILKSSYFEYLVNLEELDLSKNGMKSIELSPFKNLTKLTHLNLSCNLIDEINRKNLEGLSELKYLDLQFYDWTPRSFGENKLKKGALQGMNKIERIIYT